MSNKIKNQILMIISGLFFFGSLAIVFSDIYYINLQKAIVIAVILSTGLNVMINFLETFHR